MLIDYAAITHVGRVRRNNEDAYLVSALDGEEPIVNGPLRHRNVCQMGLLAAVADGMGGAAAGEIASREGLASVAVYLFGHWARYPDEQNSEFDLMKALKGAAEEASNAVIRYSYDDRSSRGMGSTLTATVIWNGNVYVAQVGDSRAYLYRRPGLVQLTRDQTLVNDMVASGSLSAEQARNHPQRNMITQALGAPRPVIAAVGKVPLRRGDRLLICSDGLHGEVPDEQIQEIFQKGFSVRKTVELLLDAALGHGGRDNVTILLLAMDDPGLPLPGSEERPEVLSFEEVAEAGGRGFLSRLGRKLVGRS